MIFPAKGFGKAIKNIEHKRRRMLNPEEGLIAIGRIAVNAHIKYFRKHAGSQTMSGGGPSASRWPGLEKSTAKYKEKHGKTTKLVSASESSGNLMKGYEYRIKGKDSVLIFNRETKKVQYLQVKGVGKKRKKFTVVATDLGKYDPPLLRKVTKAMRWYVFRGKRAKVA